jgi:hypothetical protein
MGPRPTLKLLWRRAGRGVRVTSLCVAALFVVSLSLGGYLASREYTEQPSIVFGEDPENPDRVDITTWVTRVDVVNQTVAVTLADVRPVGTAARQDGSFAENAVLETNAVQTAALNVRAGEAFPNVEQRFSLTGTVTDFPFDRYTSYMSFRMTRADGSELPTTVTITSTDAFFIASPYYDVEQSDWLNVNLGVKRSPPTMVFGVFIMVLMLGLALNAALAAYFVVRYRQGLVFGAYSVMAALLFAMVPLRNAVPGDPPIGSVIDFTAFFIAEAVISVSLITSVVIGYRHQLEIDRGDRRP